MRDRIRTLRFLFSKGEPEPVHHVSVVTPAGYHTPRTVDTLCRSPLRKPACNKYGKTAHFRRMFITGFI